MSTYDTAQRPPLSHAVASFTVELFYTPRHYVVHATSKCGIEFNVHCDRIIDDGRHEATAIIWQHEQGIGKPQVQVEQTIVTPTPTPASVTATWADVFNFDPARNASYARLEAALDAQFKSTQ